MTKLKNENCDKPQVVSKLTNSNCDQTQKLKLWQYLKTQGFAILQFLISKIGRSENQLRRSRSLGMSPTPFWKCSRSSCLCQASKLLLSKCFDFTFLFTEHCPNLNLNRSKYSLEFEILSSGCALLTTSQIL